MTEFKRIKFEDTIGLSLGELCNLANELIYLEEQTGNKLVNWYYKNKVLKIFEDKPKKRSKRFKKLSRNVKKKKIKSEIKRKRAIIRKFIEPSIIREN